MRGESTGGEQQDAGSAEASATVAGTPPRDDASLGRRDLTVENAPLVTNAAIGMLLREMAEVLALEHAGLYRVRAYRMAAEGVEEFTESVAAIAREHPERLLELPGVGPSVAHRIEEIARTGRLRELDEPDRRDLLGTAQLMRVPGIGLSRARLLVRTLGVRTLDELANAARSGRLREIPGLGATTEARIVHDVDSLLDARTRLLRPAAERYGETILRAVTAAGGVRRAALAGEYRRACDSLGHLRLVVSCDRDCDVPGRLVSLPLIGEVRSRDATGASVLLHTGIRVTLDVVDDENFGLHLLRRTGTRAHVQGLADRAAARGMTLSAHGLFENRRRVAGREEQDVYAALGLPWIPPELREGRGEIDAAAEGRLPRLVALEDVRGDLQCHTTDSDGRHSLERMAAGAESLGYEYLAVTDHSPALRIVRGLDREGYRRQWERIDALNARFSRLTLLKGAEVDIAEDGTLDMDDETLAGFDIVLVSIHSRFALPAAAQTRRLVRAVTHPHVDILAHPTGRIIGRRPPAAFDAREVFRAAAEHGVMVEVNGQPDRLDLDDRLCHAALDHGVRISLGTDAHAVRDLAFMRWGVDQARRGWASPDRVANTLPLAELRQLLHGRR